MDYLLKTTSNIQFLSVKLTTRAHILRQLKDGLTLAYQRIKSRKTLELSTLLSHADDSFVFKSYFYCITLLKDDLSSRYAYVSSLYLQWQAR